MKLVKSQTVMELSISCLALLLFVLGLASGQAQIFSENFDSQTVGATATGFTTVGPATATPNVLGAVIVANGQSGRGLNLYDYNSTANAYVQQDFTGLDNAHLSVSFKRNGNYTPTVTTAALYVSLGAYGLGQNTSVNRAADVRLFNDGTFRIDRGTVDGSGNFVTNSSTSYTSYGESGTTYNWHTVDLYVYSGTVGGATLSYTGPDGNTRILDPKSFAVYIDNVLQTLSDTNLTVHGDWSLQSATFYGSSNNLGRLGAITGPTANTNINFLVDNVVLNTITAVSGPPSIAPAGQPQSTNAVAGGSASFTVTVSGSPQFTYQWRKGGVNYGAVTVSSSITNRLTLSSLTTNNAGSYDVVVTNSFGSVTSSLATLTVSIPPAITLQPSGQSLCGSGGASFTAAASGFPTPSVQWQVSTNNGAAWANIAGATSTTYSFSAASGDSGKRYRAVFTNTGGTATSAAVTLAVNSPPAPVNTTATATRDRTLIIDIAALLGLSSAPDGDAFYLSAVGPLSTNGTPVAITATNTISYQPASGFTGADRFNYTITDILGCSASAEVGITVNP